jgi:hypothetical protein
LGPLGAGCFTLPSIRAGGAVSAISGLSLSVAVAGARGENDADLVPRGQPRGTGAVSFLAAEEDHMKSHTALSRRRMLASVPVLAATMTPVAATALPGLGTAIPEHLDPQRVKGLADALEMLERLPKGEANKVLTAITETIELSMRNHAHDAELMTLRPHLDAAFEVWWQETKARISGDYHEARSDEEIAQAADKLWTLIDKVLSYSPMTREGLKLQCKALIMDELDDWDERSARFVGNFVMYFGMKDVPELLTGKLLHYGWEWSDENEEGDEEEVDAA